MAHRFIAEWQWRYKTIILTQNVDNLLERVGCTDVIHLHGHVQEMICMDCQNIWNIGYRPWETNDRCPNILCDSARHVKPNVVFFNEFPPNYRFFKRAFKDLEYNDIALVTGTSGKVIPVGRYLMECLGYKIFNALEDSPTPEVYNERILLPATQAFPIIDRILRDRITRRFLT
jgi:NAD-dependent deacetylase